MLWPKRLIEKVRRIRGGDRNDCKIQTIDKGAESMKECETNKGSGIMCCPCVFRGRRPVAAVEMTPTKEAPIEAWGTPVLSITALEDDIVTKSPLSARTDSFVFSHDSVETHQLSSGLSSEEGSSDGERRGRRSMHTPPPAPPPTERHRPSPPPVHQRERFISLDSPEASEDDTDCARAAEVKKRNMVYAKLQSEVSMGDVMLDESRPHIGPRLSKSHADLRDTRPNRHDRKNANSAPHQRHSEQFQILPDPLTPESLEDVHDKLKTPEECKDTGTEMEQTESFMDLEMVDEQTQEVEPEMEDSNRSEEMTEEKEEEPPQKTPPSTKNNSQQISPANMNTSTSQTTKIPKTLSKRNSLMSISRRESFHLSTKPVAQGVYSESLRPFVKPREGLQETMAQLESGEWESAIRGLQGLVRLVRHHRDLVEGNCHSICVLLGRHVKNLRSQVARAACAAAGEMLETQRRSMETELEELAAPLLQRTADTNRFLRADAHSALEVMIKWCNPTRVVQVLNLRGFRHHNALVRCTSARLLASLVRRLGHEKFFALPRDTRDKVLKAGADMLTEGSLDTRKHAKEMFSQLQSSPHLQRSLIEAIPPATMRHISKTIANLK